MRPDRRRLILVRRPGRSGRISAESCRLRPDIYVQVGPEWEIRIDTIMHEQAATVDPERRRELFNDAQRIFAENVPVLYFVAPRLYFAHSKRTMGVVPSVMRPPILWNADSLSVAGP